MERAFFQVLVLVVGHFVLTALWQWGPVRGVTPDVLPLFVFYIGFRSQKSLGVALLTTLVAAYFWELLYAYPRGAACFVSLLVTMLGYGYGKKFVLRGLWVSAGVSGLLSVFYCVCLGMVVSSVAGRLNLLPNLKVLGVFLLFGLIMGPIVFRVLKQVDSLFARTMRDRLAILEGHL